jgi:hypothetical protein
MAQRTIYTCDRCKADFLDTANGHSPFEAQWGWSTGERLGMRVFLLCGACTEALAGFLGMPEILPKKGPKPPKETAQP